MTSLKMNEYLSEQVFKNPYILIKILRRLDIRTLSQCQSVSKHFFNCVVSENERRKDVIHLYLLNHIQRRETSEPRDVLYLFESFSQFTQMSLNIKPKNVFLMVGGYQQNQIDYRHKRGLHRLSECLPKNCQIVYLDVGHTILTSSNRYKSVTNYSESQAFQRTALPCMSCLLIPDIEGVHIKTYNRIESVDTIDVKCILLFMSSKKMLRKTKLESREEIQRTKSDVSRLMGRLYNVSFGGGAVVGVIKANNALSEEFVLREHLVITFGGNGVRTASSVISTTNDEQYLLSQLNELKRGLDFDCDEWKTAITIGYIFANNENFSMRFANAFRTVFPSVVVFGFEVNNRMYGKNYSNKDNSDLNRLYEDINPLTNCVIVLVNIQIKRF